MAVDYRIWRVDKARGEATTRMATHRAKARGHLVQRTPVRSCCHNCQKDIALSSPVRWQYRHHCQKCQGWPPRVHPMRVQNQILYCAGESKADRAPTAKRRAGGADHHCPKCPTHHRHHEAATTARHHHNALEHAQRHTTPPRHTIPPKHARNALERHLVHRHRDAARICQNLPPPPIVQCGELSRYWTHHCAIICLVQRHTHQSTARDGHTPSSVFDGGVAFSCFFVLLCGHHRHTLTILDSCRRLRHFRQK